MKEYIKEQQAQSEGDGEHASLYCENAIREHKALRHLDNQLRAQIAALQDN